MKIYSCFFLIFKKLIDYFIIEFIKYKILVEYYNFYLYMIYNIFHPIFIYSMFFKII